MYQVLLKLFMVGIYTPYDDDDDEEQPGKWLQCILSANSPYICDYQQHSVPWQ